ncbi:hypothetical protein P1D17_015930 [Acinetobacter baumannii]|uniref:hypothetical protein n=1 Tax=Acinetobacter baumannii TaxID=470 RepID=UPI000A644D1A|nr:hypothetical protein [Acinetobacter baumannii]MDF9675637.1 hypothetical protein [Acinetobacter baumannii]MDF9690301.1 hypothetical protein [Acinetobacter baumannii]
MSVEYLEIDPGELWPNPWNSNVNPGAGSKTKQENKGLQKEQPKTSLEKIMAGLRGES